MRKPHLGPHDGYGEASPGDTGSSGSDLLVVSNRQPYRHEFDDGEFAVDRPAGGLTAGLDAAMRSVDGTWIAWGDGDADAEVVDGANRVAVPPDADAGQYDLERVWLSEDQEHDYYYGFSNRVLWPICHSALTEVVGKGRYWDHYRQVNELFAETVANAAGDSVVWFHDYHLAIAPERVRERTGGRSFLLHTWHIPWPSWDVFRACPHGRELLCGLLGNDLVGFHVGRYCENFLRCVANALPEARVDWDHWHVDYAGGRTAVRAFPMGVDAETIHREADSEVAHEFWADFADEHDLEGRRVGVGVDRLDYSKGIDARVRALERLWEREPEWRDAFTFVQVGTESRSLIPAYSDYQAEVEDAIDRVNDRFGTDDWTPIVYTTEMLDDEALYALYREADVAVISPIRDGMNLVAQEYVAAQHGAGGALVLSDQVGAHDELHEWVLSINPHDSDAVASTIDDALRLPVGERRARMNALRQYVADHDIDAWMDDVLGTVDAMRRPAESTAAHV
jgi:trehalose 6-phosphate synthase